VDDADRAAIDAPARKRRAIAFVLLLLTLGVVVVAAVVLQGEPAPPPTPIAVISPPPPAIVAPPPPPPPVLPVDPPPRVLAPVVRRARAPVVEQAAATTVVVGDLTGGDPLVRKAMQRAFKGSLGRLDVRARAESGYSVTVHVDEQKQRGDEITVRCAVTVSLLPKRNVLASLKARADVEGTGTPVDELFNDAAEACGQALAKDLTGWVRAHPL